MHSQINPVKNTHRTKHNNKYDIFGYVIAVKVHRNTNNAENEMERSENRKKYTHNVNIHQFAFVRIRRQI